ncbi:MAG TPA: DUF1559 domain-containing protein [Planctomycetaceae bacterium]|nr:DUF1559 domain-containing protein [Planctomycetaceae bacterium]
MACGVTVLVLVSVFEPARVLAFGWVQFLARVLPRMTVFWPSILAGGLALVLLLIGIHVSGRRFLRKRDAADAPRRWKLRWTLVIVAGVLVLFAAGIGLVGLTHQVIWLMGSEEPLYGAAYKADWTVDSHGQLQNVGLAIGNWSDAYGSLPPGGSFDEHGRPLHSWETHLLPYLGYYAPIERALSWRHPENKPHFLSVLPAVLNPDLRIAAFVDENGFGLSHYSANVHVLGPDTKTRWGQITDGLANTILIGEVNDRFVPWGDPVNWRDPARGINRSPDGFGGPESSGGAQFLMADGSVRLVSEQTSRRVLSALSTPAAGDGP